MVIAERLAEYALAQRLGARHRGELFGMANAELVDDLPGLAEILVRPRDIFFGFLQCVLGVSLFTSDQKRGHDQAHYHRGGDRCRRANSLSMPAAPFGDAARQRRPPSEGRHPFPEPPQVVGQLLRGGIALLAILGNRFQNNILQVQRDRRIDAPRAASVHPR